MTPSRSVMFPAKPGTVRQTGSFSGRAYTGTPKGGNDLGIWSRAAAKTNESLLAAATFLSGSVRASGVDEQCGQAQVWGLLFVGWDYPRIQMPLIRPEGASPQYCYIMRRKITGRYRMAVAITSSASGRLSIN